ncbi:lytic transglycosylase domain-containing protein [Methylocapsa acidiphila]|uniref:lytic transglycosylase domain-containing protein n=1 Tax=Methylocapsa acidiphila TaxID=133552 RepID=UPI000425ADBD|nr:lytic transglycosylase domain-containing protein [Methylocapsa acidiphila]
MLKRQSTARLMAGIFASALFGLAGAWIEKRGIGFDLFGLQDDGPTLVAFDPPDVPFLHEGEFAEDDEASPAGRGFAEAETSAPRNISPALVAHELGLDLTGLTEAIGFYKAGSIAAGDAAAKAAKDKTVQTTLEWVALRNFPREAGFERIQAFIAAHPTWPALAWLRKRSEEALYGDRKSPALIKAFFNERAPETAAGKLALARALVDEGKTDEAAGLVRDVWREADFNAATEAKIKADYGSYLTKADHKYRADRLLYKEQTANALRMAALAGPDVIALAKARAAVISEAASDKLLAAVPTTLRADPGFMFAQIQKLRRADKIREAVDIMLAAPRDPALIVNGDEWWVERRLLARKLLDQDDAKTAYKLCAEHSAMSHEMKLEAEFHAGWIALRFLNDSARAAEHFAALAKLAETPMSRARAAYWQGRAAEASPSEDAAASARSFYLQAAAHPATYYGQLARGRLGLTTLPIRALSNEATGDARDDSVRAVELLYAIGEKNLATALAIEAVRGLGDQTQIAALASVVERQQDAHISLAIGKAASQRGIALDRLAFPNYGVPSYHPLQNSADSSIVYSIARQESAFDPNAVSSAGAKGLMQMIASTARRTADHAGVAFNESRLLSDAAFNAQLAAAHLGELLAEHRGSYILTFAAYNAGGKRVKQWIDAYGDPRKPGVDPIDWVERIPFTETRNYVQRVIENLGVYRTLFGEGAPIDPAAQKTQAKL